MMLWPRTISNESAAGYRRISLHTNHLDWGQRAWRITRFKIGFYSILYSVWKVDEYESVIRNEIKFFSKRYEGLG